MNTFASVALTLAKMDLYVHPESDKFNTHGDKSPNIFLLCIKMGYLFTYKVLCKSLRPLLFSPAKKIV